MHLTLNSQSEKGTQSRHRGSFLRQNTHCMEFRVLNSQIKVIGKVQALLSLDYPASKQDYSFFCYDFRWLVSYYLQIFLWFSFWELNFYSVFIAFFNFPVRGSIYFLLQFFFMGLRFLWFGSWPESLSRFRVIIVISYFISMFSHLHHKESLPLPPL